MVEKMSKEMERERAEADLRVQESSLRELETIKGKQKAEAKTERATELARKFEKELREEKAVNKGLMENIGKMKERVDGYMHEKEDFAGKIKDLEDQLRDVMFFLDAKMKIEEGGGAEAEAAGGTMVVPQPPAAGGKAKGKKRYA
jgi:BRCA1-associated protein